ncbi:hypothetical protein FG05_35013 [Fusarium graminearum]|nr:hypothetical protein FG05_35013 [Fusarium graminearum]
MQEEYILLPV